MIPIYVCPISIYNTCTALAPLTTPKKQEPPLGFKFLYPDSAPIKEKLATIVKEMYGGDGVTYSEAAEEQIEAYTKVSVCLCLFALHR